MWVLSAWDLRARPGSTGLFCSFVTLGRPVDPVRALKSLVFTNKNQLRPKKRKNNLDSNVK